MRRIIIAAVALAAGGCMHTESAEIRDSMRRNAADATETARTIASDNDPEGNAATCYVFIGLSRHARSNAVGHDDVAMAQAQSQYYAILERQLTKQGADQMIGSSVNPLTPADPAARDAASRYCVENVPTADPTPGS